MPTTMPAMVPIGVPPSLGGATVTVAGDGVNSDEVGVVEADVVDKLARLAVLRAVVAEDVVVVEERSLMLK